MQKNPIHLFLIPLLAVCLLAPAVTMAKNGGDDDWDEDEDESGLEVEADVYTDMTIVKVEINDKKTIFSTDADDRAGVVDEVVSRFAVTAAEVDAVLDLEIEDRASRTKERAKLSHRSNKNKDYVAKVRECRDNDDALEIEADVFTDTTIVKVELVNAKDVVFTTSATTSADIVAAVAGRFSELSTSSIEAALDLEIEDRASRTSDKVVDEDCMDSRLSTSTTAINEAKIAELRARVAELQTLLEKLISVLRGN